MKRTVAARARHAIGRIRWKRGDVGTAGKLGYEAHIRVGSRRRVVTVREPLRRVYNACPFVIFLASGLLLSGTPAGAQEPITGVEPFTPQDFQERRTGIAQGIGPGAFAVIPGASADHSSTRFRQSNQFYYLTGLETPNSYLVIEGGSGRSTLYLPAVNEGRDRTDGPALSLANPEEVIGRTGVAAVRPLDQMSEDLGRRNPSGTPVYVPFKPAEGHAASRAGILRAEADRFSDPWDGRLGREAHFVHLLRTRFPFLEIKNLSPILDELRLIKSAKEIAVMERATRLGGEALMEAMRSTEPGVKEKELDALARFLFVRHGAQGEAFRAIVASGPNAWFAHHRASPRTMREGEMVLMDYCPDLAYYRCDVTRMWPVSGRFSPEQRELYGFYLEFYEAILRSIRPGISPQQVKVDALAEIDRVLEGWAFSQPHFERAARDFVEAYRRGAEDPGTRLGHHVGLSTHDPAGRGAGLLQPGMVFVIEPQFRVPEDNVYMRIEDIIVITEDGVDILSDFVPRSIDGIEALMEEEGILQRIPRIP